MKIEKISENIVRVTISTDDLEERNIDINSLNYNSPAAKELFWDMVEQAEAQLGFSISDSQLIIEPTPDLKEGFTVTITKIDEESEFESMQKYIKSRFKKVDLKAKRKSRNLCSSLVIYSFESFEDLCSLCKKIKPLYVGESSVYKLKDLYYLVMVKESFIQPSTGLFEATLSEFGTRIQNTNFYEGYLNEYGTNIIMNNAIQIIEEHF